MAWISLNQFYKSKEWLGFRATIIVSRAPICWHCNKEFKADDSIICHHKIELTLGNVNDYNISLNKENVEMVHHECHNAIHKRYGFGHYKKVYKPRTVYIVYGPPFSGKTSYVIKSKTDKDLVVDMDKIFQCVTMLPLYNKPSALTKNVFSIKNTLIDNIKTRFGNFHNAYVIGGYADKYERERLQKELGAELIFINPNKEDVYKRLEECTDHRKDYKEEWKSYIDSWYEKYVE